MYTLLQAWLAMIAKHNAFTEYACTLCTIQYTRFLGADPEFSWGEGGTLIYLWQYSQQSAKLKLFRRVWGIPPPPRKFFEKMHFEIEFDSCFYWNLQIISLNFMATEPKTCWSIDDRLKISEGMGGRGVRSPAWDRIIRITSQHKSSYKWRSRPISWIV